MSGLMEMDDLLEKSVDALLIMHAEEDVFDLDMVQNGKHYLTFSPGKVLQ